MALRVVFADDNYLVRQGVTSLLAEVEDIDVVAVATDLASLMESVAETSPDVVLTDIRMPPTHTNEGIEAARADPVASTRASASWSSRSTSRRTTPSSCWPTASPAWATCSRRG